MFIATIPVLLAKDKAIVTMMLLLLVAIMTIAHLCPRFIQMYSLYPNHVDDTYP